jgi:hypothetical protein
MLLSDHSYNIEKVKMRFYGTSFSFKAEFLVSETQGTTLFCGAGAVTLCGSVINGSGLDYDGLHK